MQSCALESLFLHSHDTAGYIIGYVKCVSVDSSSIKVIRRRVTGATTRPGSMLMVGYAVQKLVGFEGHLLHNCMCVAGTRDDPAVSTAIKRIQDSTSRVRRAGPTR